MALSVSAPSSLSRIQRATIRALEIVDEHEVLNAQRRVLIGFALHSIKTHLKHGEFQKWLDQHLPGRGLTSCYYAMRAATACLESGNVSGLSIGDQNWLERKALSARSLDLTKATTAFTRQVRDFVGELSFTELLEKHGIRAPGKKLGGARAAGEAETAATLDAEQLYLFSRDEIGSTLQSAEKLLLAENRLQHLVGHPEEIRGIVESLRALAEKVERAARPLLEVEAPQS